MQKRLFFSPEYIIVSTILTILVLVSTWLVHSPLLGIPALILFVLFFGQYIGQTILTRESRYWQLFFGGLTLSAICVTILSGIYFIHEMNNLILSILLILTPLIISYLPHPNTSAFQETLQALKTSIQTPTRSQLVSLIVPGLILLGDLILFLKLFSVRTTDTPISPWSLVGPKFFLVFFVVTTILLYYLSTRSNDQSSSQKREWTGASVALPLLIPHFVLFFSITLILFVYGFGFDPFIHQAAERWILEHGVITPKQPYYIGQYMIVLVGHYLTHLDVHTLDKLLTPVTASILVPITTYFSFSRLGFQQKILSAIITLLLIPLSFFALSTPNNLALVFAFITILFFWYQTKHHNPQLFIISGSLVALTTAIHAFIGIPLAAIFLAFLFYTKQHQFSTSSRKVRTALAAAYLITLSTSLPLVFWLNGLRTGETIGLQNPLTHLTNLKQFFEVPHWYWITPAPLSWDILYHYKITIPIIVAVIIAIGIYIAYRKHNDILPTFWLLTASGLSLLAGFLITTLRFPNVISYEQGVYADRITELALLTLLPFFILAIRELLLWIETKRYSHIPLTILFVTLITISWYFTYPTRDAVSRYTGYSVREADIEAVHSIQKRNDNQFTYIVLTNQTVAAAALREFGFAKYWPTEQGEQYFYSIPTGGPLYQYFRKMVYEYPKKQWMQEAMDFAGADRAYFIHTNYWYPAAELRDTAKLEADDWWAVGENPEKAWVFEYIR